MTYDSVEEVDSRIEEIEEDNRLPEDYPEQCAGVQVNAPLALIQTGLSKELRTLKAVRPLLEDAV